MDDILPILLQTALFDGFTAAEAKQLLPLLQPVQRRYTKGQILLLAGSRTSDIGIVLKGRIEAVKHGHNGAQFTVASVTAGGVFGDVLSGSHTESPVTLSAAVDSRVLLLPTAQLFHAPSGSGELFRRLLANLVGVISDKYFSLNARLDLLLMKGLRRRVAAYLLAEGKGRENVFFTIPFSRAELASYLGCERSALSREISALAQMDLIETHRSQFCIRSTDALQALLLAEGSPS